MNWPEFANKIAGKLNDNSDGFIGGDIMVKRITKMFEGNEILIKKEIRRAYEASSHFNVEKLEFEYRLSKMDFGRNRVRRKYFLLRIGKNREEQYRIDGNVTEGLKRILSTEELKYVLQYPKSEFILLGNTIRFKSQSLGIMKEDLNKIYSSMENLKRTLMMK